jgi:hypothetical protein
MEPHRIPNALLGWLNGGTTLVNVFFPMLYDECRSSVALSGPEMQRWYDLVMRPAAMAVAPKTAASWPVSYDAEIFQQKTAGGGVALPTVRVAAVPALGVEIQRRLADQDWGQLAFFLTFSHHKAMQLDDGHNDRSVTCFEAELENVAQGLDLDALYAMDTTDDGCYVQVETEVNVEGHSVFWNRQGHRCLLEELFPESTGEECEEWTQRQQSGYTRDPVAQFTEISGFQFKVVRYMTMPSYITD